MNVSCAFSNIKNILRNELEGAKNEISIAVAWFTNNELFELLLKKASEGLRINIVLINDYTNNRPDGLPLQSLIDNGIQLYFGSHETPMHNKFCIIDNETLITGSYNWTYYAEYKNQENIVIFKQNNDLIKSYQDEFFRLISLATSISNIVPNLYPKSNIMDSAIYLAEDYYYHAQEALMEGNRNVALSLLKSASQLQPDNINVERKRQEVYTHLKNNWDKEYEISQIRFDEDKTIIYFKVETRNCHFFGPKHEHAWFIRDSNNFDQVYKMTSVRNLMRNSSNPKDLLDDEKYSFTMHSSYPNQLHSCELHFPPLPNHIRMIDLIEGSSNKLDEVHWNFFDYRLPNRV